MDKNIFKEYLSNYNFNIEVDNLNNIQIDSRKIERGDIFVAIKGENNDGNNFIEEVLNKGVELIISDNEKTKEKYGNKVLFVENSIKFLQDFSSYYRDKINPIVIGITGSNGKTTTKDFLFSILNKVGKAKKTLGNLNNHIGVPLTLLQLEQNDKYIVVEMGMSGFGEIDLLAKISKPDYGIITNIGDSHMEYMKTRENVYKAKTELIKYVRKKMFLNGDDEYLKKENGIKIGFGDSCNIKGENVYFSEKGTYFDVVIDGMKYDNFYITLAGEHNVLDALFALGVAYDLGINIETIKEGLKETEFTKMRFEKLIKNDIIYINDAYNASPISMKYSIETFSQIYNEGNFIKIAILGDMLELGEESKKFHEGLSEVLINARIDKIYLYGKEMFALYEVIKGKKETFYFNNKEEIKEKIKNETGKKVILLKGSRGMKLEEIIE